MIRFFFFSPVRLTVISLSFGGIRFCQVKKNVKDEGFEAAARSFVFMAEGVPNDRRTTVKSMLQLS